MRTKHEMVANSRSRARPALAVAVIAMVAIATPALAVDIPPAQTGASYQVTIPANGSSTDETLYGDASQVLVSQNGTPMPGMPYVRSEANPFGVVSAYSNAASVQGYNAFGSAFVAYSFTVLGDEGYTGLIPIDYTARLSAVASAYNDGVANFSGAVADAGLYIVALGQATSYRAAICTSGCVGDQPTSLAISDTLYTRTGDIMFVDLSASTEAGNLASAVAYADPYFFIDPAFLADHGGFSLQFSPSVGNDPTPSAVPEPASWAMMIGGFGLVGTALRRRRTAGIVAAFI